MMASIFRSRLKTYRKNAGLTQKELSEKLSVSQQAVARWESGSTEPNITMLYKIADALNTSVSNLLGNGTISMPYLIADEFYSINDYANIPLPDNYFITNAHQEDMQLIYPDLYSIYITDKQLLDIASETYNFLKFRLDQLRKDQQK